jgi:hypothetical protein
MRTLHASLISRTGNSWCAFGLRGCSWTSSWPMDRTRGTRNVKRPLLRITLPKKNVNLRCIHTPSVIALLDAHAKISSDKSRDVDHRGLFLAFLGATCLVVATGACLGAKHVTFRLSTCIRVQIEYVATRGRAQPFADRESTIDEFVSASAALGHCLIAVPIAFDQCVSVPAASRRRCGVSRAAILFPHDIAKLRARLRIGYVCGRGVEPSSECAVMQEQFRHILADISPVQARKACASPFIAAPIFRIHLG